MIDLAAEGGAGGQVEGSIGLTRARMLALTGDVEEARVLFASERADPTTSGQRALAAMADHDEGICLAAAGAAQHAEASRLLEAAAATFEELGMRGWTARTRRLLESGLHAAATPGGR